MTKMKHTPGPWSAVRNSHYWEIQSERDGQIGDMCASRTIYHNDVEIPEAEAEIIAEANAHLGAAAPDMYEASLFAKAAEIALARYEADYGEKLPDDYEIGRIDESRSSPSFRLKVGHIRMLATALARAEGRS